METDLEVMGLCECGRTLRGTVHVEVTMYAGGLPARLSFAPPLSLPRLQLKVLEHVQEGLTDREIGKLLGLSIDQVKHALREALTALAARNRAHAVAIAIYSGLLRPGLSEWGEHALGHVLVRD